MYIVNARRPEPMRNVALPIGKDRIVGLRRNQPIQVAVRHHLHIHRLSVRQGRSDRCDVMTSMQPAAMYASPLDRCAAHHDVVHITTVPEAIRSAMPWFTCAVHREGTGTFRAASAGRTAKPRTNNTAHPIAYLMGKLRSSSKRPHDWSLAALIS